ncbi:hypothetical protein B194_2459 [Serratia plymuthica A30]|nr:hypothetical protein B194_2459 [Serratia plymuthica A30]
MYWLYMKDAVKQVATLKGLFDFCACLSSQHYRFFEITPFMY